jgi:threonine dehydratase
MPAPRLSLADIEAAEPQIDPVFRSSPQYICEPLGYVLGCTLTVKVETQNPIRSFKGRGADWLMTQNTAPRIVCASAGNFGQAMAYAGRARNVPVVVYAATNANPLKLDRMRALGATVILHGHDFDAAKTEARRIAPETGDRFVEDSLDIETLVGAGTIGTELARLPYRLDALLVPLGNGALINGIGTALKALSPHTQIIAIQAEGAPAMIESWQRGRVMVSEKADTIADGIGVRVPVPQALTDMQGLVDAGLLVSEASIIEGMRLLHQHTGLVVEPSGAVGIAALLENRDRFAGLHVGTVLCGGNLTQEQMRQWL